LKSPTFLREQERHRPLREQEPVMVLVLGVGAEQDYPERSGQYGPKGTIYPEEYALRLAGPYRLRLAQNDGSLCAPQTFHDELLDDAASCRPSISTYLFHRVRPLLGSFREILLPLGFSVQIMDYFLTILLRAFFT